MRHLLGVALALALSTLAALGASIWAQQPNRIAVVGRLAVVGNVNDQAQDAFRNGMRELGYVEGRDFRFEYRSAEGQVELLSRLAEELVRMKVDVIVTGTENSTRAVNQATGTIPIVAVLPDHDPVASGLIRSFNRPGGNITGVTGNTQLVGKRLQLLKEMLPALSRVAVFWDPFVRGQVEELKPAARSLDIQLLLLEVKTPVDFDVGFKAARQQKAGAVMLLGSPQVYGRQARLGELALENRLPTEATFHGVTEAGGLVSYSSGIAAGFYRAAYFVDRIFKGAKPADLPFEQVAEIELVVNLKTARALNVAVPKSILLRANKVIQ